MLVALTIAVGAIAFWRLGVTTRCAWCDRPFAFWRRRTFAVVPRYVDPCCRRCARELDELRRCL